MSLYKNKTWQQFLDNAPKPDPDNERDLEYLKKRWQWEIGEIKDGAEVHQSYLGTSFQKKHYPHLKEQEVKR